MSRLVYLIGEPGVGKSTAMRNATAAYARAPMDDSYVARDLLWLDGTLVAVEIGRRRGVFSGTDALGMSVIGQAERYVQDQPEQPPILLAEGARLANARFLRHALKNCGRVDLLYLDDAEGAAQRRAERSLQLGKAQNPAWVKGRATAARNLADSAPSGVVVTRVQAGESAAQFIRSAIKEES